jgi:hypothetical protein
MPVSLAKANLFTINLLRPQGRGYSRFVLFINRLMNIIRSAAVDAMREQPDIYISI